MTSNMIYIVSLSGGLKCPRKIQLNTQWRGGGRSSSSGKSWIIEARPTNCHLLAIYRPTTRKLFRSRQATAAAPMCARLCVPDPKYGANNVKWTCRLTTSPALSSSQHHQWAVQGFGLIVSFNFAIIDRMELDENLVVSRIQLADRWCLSWYRKPANYWPCFRDNVHNTQLDLARWLRAATANFWQARPQQWRTH